ncbi:unnamed protein product [Diatraea saccharalis]|uniref:KAT8 regulatory NSL complex subunit 2 n=1 Tax=Diatraea saccharalis TaxID=40085 RepID=A0A9N9RBR7_9NEOP|nr:unnamed protein product [Diatraea saccharalis]
MSQPRKVIHLPKVRMLRPSSVGRPGGLRITNIKAIRPPDPEAIKKQEEEKLRAELEKEIMSRSRSCANKTYECTLPVLSGRQYCVKHILKDPTAPYKQCAHIYSNGERCQQPAPSENKDHRDQGLCFEHARVALHARQRSAAPPPPVTTTETLLNQLQHYVRPERARTTSCASSVSVVSDHDPDNIAPTPLDPFKQIDATAVNAQYSASIMECASGTDSDADSVTLGPGGSCRETGPIEHCEEAPCEEGPLWRAGVYTAEEAVWCAKNSLRSLQSLYVKQMGRLKVLLQMARAQYIKSLKAEKEQYCSINSQARSGPLTVRERRQLRKLKAYAAYHRHHRVEALLARKLHRKRAKMGSDSNRPGPQGRCSFAEGGVRCSIPALPAAKHCMRHILLDRHQVLFTACGDSRGCASCGEPSARLPLPTLACRYHAAPPHLATFTLKKDDSDSESDSHSSSDESQADDFVEHSSDKHEIAPVPESPFE